MAALTTTTRRGLVLTLYAELVLVSATLIFLLLSFVEEYLRAATRVLVAGVVLSGLLGLPGAWALKNGRREFGPEHARAAKRGLALLALVGVCLLLAYFQLTTVFPDPKEGEAGGRLVNLRGPLVFLGVALLADAAAVPLILGRLAGDEAKTWIRIALGAALVGVPVYFLLGWRAIDDYLVRTGPITSGPHETESFILDFYLDAVRPFALVLMAIRAGFLPALMISIRNVTQAEREAEAADQAVRVEPAR